MIPYVALNFLCHVPTKLSPLYFFVRSPLKQLFYKTTKLAASSPGSFGELSNVGILYGVAALSVTFNGQNDDADTKDVELG